jgi:hypothetical protein
LFSVDIGKLAPLINYCSVGAYFCALTAFVTKGFNESHLRVRGNTLGIAAPLTFKTASF